MIRSHCTRAVETIPSEPVPHVLSSSPLLSLTLSRMPLSFLTITSGAVLSRSVLRSLSLSSLVLLPRASSYLGPVCSDQTSDLLARVFIHGSPVHFLTYLAALRPSSGYTSRHRERLPLLWTCSETLSFTYFPLSGTLHVPYPYHHSHSAVDVGVPHSDLSFGSPSPSSSSSRGALTLSPTPPLRPRFSCCFLCLRVSTQIRITTILDLRLILFPLRDSSVQCTVLFRPLFSAPSPCLASVFSLVSGALLLSLPFPASEATLPSFVCPVAVQHRLRACAHDRISPYTDVPS